MSIEEKVLNGTHSDVVGREETDEQDLDDVLDAELDDEETEDADLTELEDSEDDDEDEKEPPKPKQSAEENAKYAAARRAAEKAQKEAEEKYKELEQSLKSQVDYVGLTDEEEADIRARAEHHGKDGDVWVLIEQNKRRDAAEKARKSLEQAESERKRTQQERAASEIKEFEGAVGIKVADLDRDEGFKDYADGKWGRKSLLEIYTGYKRIKGEAVSTATRAARGRSDRSTGAASVAVGGLSVGARRGLEEWNKRNPHSKMTEQEYRELLKGD